MSLGNPSPTQDAFVLHDMFALPLEEIAAMVELGDRAVSIDVFDDRELAA